MGIPTIDLGDIRTFWGCVPVPEQTVLVQLGELAQTPAQSISFNDVKALMTIAGAQPADKRTEILFDYPGITTIDSGNPLCGDPDGCILFATSVYLGQVFACRLLGGCQVGAPVSQPCYYATTAPNI